VLSRSVSSLSNNSSATFSRSSSSAGAQGSLQKQGLQSLRPSSTSAELTV